ncbi:MAG: membrane protein insertase YidC [Gammaproteobacteria bacterium]|nr:membrane protein insertase YidC [Gammaproteobacteria bacterium]
MEQIRLILIVALVFTSFQLWEAWHKDYPPPLVPNLAPITEYAPPPLASPTASVPPEHLAVPTSESAPTTTATVITAKSDLLTLNISSTGGTITSATLLAYPVNTHQGAPAVELLGTDSTRLFLQESGLTGAIDLPTHHSTFTADADAYVLADDADKLDIPLHWIGANGTTVEKHIILERGSYVVTIEYVINNPATATAPVQARLYAQLKRNDESSLRGMVYTFTGPALSTPAKRFEKFNFDQIEDTPIAETATDAWIGIIQHYFVAALIPPSGAPTQFYAKVLDDQHYVVGFQSPPLEIAPAETRKLATRLYIGPKRHDIISTVAPGLELSVDFGALWFIAKPLFLALGYFKELTGNWGWAILVVTFLLKLLFFPLSAAGYRSMAKMRKVQPRMLTMRDRYKDDRAALNQAMMKLYKDEKINPLGGCFPILIQIPVFIALYWVLLESVEMRQAPFILWVHDLSERDPYFVLPLLMGISMWAQQKLNPAPIDPMQAKVMQVMPIVFTAFFAFFPSGLVLYWFINNMLSIAQQWQITRTIDAASS